MKTTIDIDLSKIEKIKELDNTLKTKKELVDLALDELIKSLNRKKLHELRGKVKWEGDLDQMRGYDRPAIE